MHSPCLTILTHIRIADNMTIAKTTAKARAKVELPTNIGVGEYSIVMTHLTGSKPNCNQRARK